MCKEENAKQIDNFIKEAMQHVIFAGFAKLFSAAVGKAVVPGGEGVLFSVTDECGKAIRDVLRLMPALDHHDTMQIAYAQLRDLRNEYGTMGTEESKLWQRTLDGLQHNCKSRLLIKEFLNTLASTDTPKNLSTPKNVLSDHHASTKRGTKSVLSIAKGIQAQTALLKTRSSDAMGFCFQELASRSAVPVDKFEIGEVFGADVGVVTVLREAMGAGLLEVFLETPLQRQLALVPALCVQVAADDLAKALHLGVMKVIGEAQLTPEALLKLETVGAVLAKFLEKSHGWGRQRGGRGAPDKWRPPQVAQL